MAWISVGILFSLGWCACGLPPATLRIHPASPLVARGGSVQLNCSIDCPGGKVQWEGLDTDFGSVVSHRTYSILTVANATVDMAGVKLCTGQCGRRSYQNRATLDVYAFPDTLKLGSQPPILTAGQAARLFCSMSHVYPHGGLTLSWFRGAERLEPAEEEEEAMEDSQEQLFLYRSVLEVPTVEEGTAYRCRATLAVGPKTFSREVAANISLPVTQSMPVTTEEATSGLKTSRGSPTKPSATAGGISPVATSSGLSPAYFAKAHTTAVATTPSKALSRTGTPIAEMQRGSPVPLTKSTSDLLHTTGVSAAHAVPSKGGQLYAYNSSLPTVVPEMLQNLTSAGQEGFCRPVIQLVPLEGVTGRALRISCHLSECRDGIGIRWVETPVSQAQYHIEDAQGQSTLLVESVTPAHQGVYRCVAMTSQPRVASVHVVVSDAPSSTSSLVAVGTAGSLLGLALTAYVSHRLRQRRGSWKQAASSTASVRL